MRKFSLIATTALLAGGFGVAVAQVAPNNRPVNVGISPQAMQAAGNTNAYQVQIDQLKAQVAALSGQLASMKTELASVRKDLGTVSSIDTQRLNAFGSKLSSLDNQYQTHSHYTVDNYTSAGVPKYTTYKSTIPQHNCAEKKYTYTGAPLEKYDCNPPK